MVNSKQCKNTVTTFSSFLRNSITSIFIIAATISCGGGSEEMAQDFGGGFSDPGGILDTFIVRNRTNGLIQNLDGIVLSNNEPLSVSWNPEAFTGNSIQLSLIVDYKVMKLADEPQTSDIAYLNATNLHLRNISTNSGSTSIDGDFFTTIGDRLKLLAVDNHGNWDISSGWLTVEKRFELDKIEQRVNNLGNTTTEAFSNEFDGPFSFSAEGYRQFAMTRPTSGGVLAYRELESDNNQDFESLYTVEWDASRFETDEITLFFYIGYFQRHIPTVFSGQYFEHMLYLVPGEEGIWSFVDSLSGELPSINYRARGRYPNTGRAECIFWSWLITHSDAS